MLRYFRSFRTIEGPPNGQPFLRGSWFLYGFNKPYGPSTPVFFRHPRRNKYSLKWWRFNDFQGEHIIGRVTWSFVELPRQKDIAANQKGLSWSRLDNLSDCILLVQIPYCWWKKSYTSWWVVHSTIYMVVHIPGARFLPSTVEHPAFTMSTTCWTN